MQYSYVSPLALCSTAHCYAWLLAMVHITSPHLSHLVMEPMDPEMVSWQREHVSEHQRE
jgi:hypothetical protein